MLRRAALALALFPPLALAQGGVNATVPAGAVGRDPRLAGVSVESKIGARPPLDVPLVDDRGNPTNPGRLLRGRPLVLLPIFYRCKGVCTTEMQGVLHALYENPKLKPGRDLDVVVLGLNPTETPELAANKKQEYLDQYGDPKTADGWVFTTGAEPNVRRVAESLGVHYRYDRAKNQVDHPSAVLVLTPQGRVSTVMTAGMYPAARFAEDVARAAKDELGEAGETSWLGCVHIDPVTGERSIVVMGVARLLAVLVVFGILATMVVQSRRRTIAVPHG